MTFESWDEVETQLARQQAQALAAQQQGVLDQALEPPTQPFNPMRMKARLGHFYPWASDEAINRMDYVRVFAYWREMVLMLEEPPNRPRTVEAGGGEGELWSIAEHPQPWPG